jgi:hypothetical protein
MFKEASLVHSFTLDRPISALRFGSYGREDSSLICVHGQVRRGSEWRGSEREKKEARGGKLGGRGEERERLEERRESERLEERRGGRESGRVDG